MRFPAGVGMKRFLIPGLVVVHLLLHALSLWLPMGRWFKYSSWPLFLLFTGFMLGPSQGALLATWIALGRRGTLWRVVLAAIGTVVYLGCFHRADDEWLALTTGEMAFMVALLLGARLTGLELTRFAQESAVRPRGQFFIRDVLAWTTALAVVLSAARFLILQGWYFNRYPKAVEFFAVFGSFAFIAVASLWAALGQRWLIVRLALPLAAVGAGAALLAAPSMGLSWEFTMILSPMAAWMVGSLLVVRWAGYRLSWHWRFSRKGIE